MMKNIKLSRKLPHCHKKHSATTLTLPWHKRNRSRQRVTLDNGEEAGLFLERGSVLRGGDILDNDKGFTVEVVAAPESLSTIVCEDALQLARLCYHLGNRHVDLQISATGVSYLHDHVLDEMIERMGFQLVISKIPFEPESGAYDDGGHRHGHSHE